MLSTLRSCLAFVRRCCAGPGLLTLLALGCASHAPSPHEQRHQAFEELRRELVRHASDRTEATRLTDLADQLEATLVEFTQAQQAARQRLLALNADYHATRSDLEAVLSSLREGNRRRSERVLAIRDEAARRMDDATWEELERFRAVALRATLPLTGQGGMQE
jgi:hypothetical protein